MKNLKIFVSSILIFLFSLGVIVISVLNLTPIYGFFIRYYNLEAATGLSSLQLKQEFKTLINYLQSPFIHNLKFSYFSMSKRGQIHFSDVKNIFIFIYSLLILILVIKIFFILKSRKKLITKNYKSFNYFFYITLCFTLTLITFTFFDFTELFYAFHRLLFSNNYWIFDPSTDPIILALPEDVFMNYGLIIISTLLCEAIVLKIIYIKKKVLIN
ncbi:integral membrane protein TIGR01906 [Clostridium cavendishii DSM 21758]|uniref:Integral membrane protein TIGR01906 n=1 Tax=Clostridium cavendishii DSM 21758 TaxID=1121302 RepID=A0A1M6LKI2_9CLOT|nr:TIGR01906 family membrane protein [Clostridium cavendishii]SHJ71628.1 integral membrane protein TIGR01906 [Clostridium cavendishii DSM 21758]